MNPLSQAWAWHAGAGGSLNPALPGQKLGFAFEGRSWKCWVHKEATPFLQSSKKQLEAPQEFREYPETEKQRFGTQVIPTK